MRDRPIRIAWAEASRFQRSAIAPLAGLRVAAGVVVVLVIGLAVGNVDAAVSMASGAILVGTASLSGGARPPVLLMAATTLSMALATFVGSLSGAVSWLHFGLLAPWCLVAGLLVALGPSQATIGVQAVIAFVVYGRFAEPALLALGLAGFVLAGGAVQVVLTVVTHWTSALRAQRNALAVAFDALAGLAADAVTASGLPVAAALDASELALTKPVLFGHADASALLGLQEVGRRVRLELIVLGAQGARLRGIEAVSALRDGQRAATVALHAVAIGLLHGGEVDTDPLDRVAERLARLATPMARGPDVGSAQPLKVVAEGVAALAGQLRAARGLVEAAMDPGRRHARLVPGHADADRRQRVRTVIDTLGANLTLASPAARHALRLCAVVMLSELIAFHTPLQRGYWVALTAAVVLRADFAATFTRGFARVLGTCAGVGVAGLVVVATGADRTTAVVLIGVLMFMGASTFRASYAVFTAFVTGAVVLLLALITGGAFSAAADRLVDTFIGGALALGAYALWPTWSDRDARHAIAGLIAEDRVYVGYVLGGFVRSGEAGTTPYDEGTARQLSKRARLARANAEAAVGRNLGEPVGHRLRGAQTTLATIRRIALSTHALRRDLDRRRRGAAPALAARSARSDRAVVGAGVPDPVAIAVGSLAAAVDSAMKLIEVDVETGDRRAASDSAAPATHPASIWPQLRRLHAELALAVTASGDDAGLLVAETDEVVDAIDTLGDLVGQ